VIDSTLANYLYALEYMAFDSQSQVHGIQLPLTV